MAGDDDLTPPPAPAQSEPRHQFSRRYNIPQSILAELSEARETLRNQRFDPKQHASESRLVITKMFLRWYFCLIAGSFIFCAVYNHLVAGLNIQLLDAQAKLAATGQTIGPIEQLPYIEVSNTVALITTTLSSGLGFVIGYYFKTKEES